MRHCRSCRRKRERVLSDLMAEFSFSLVLPFVSEDLFWTFGMFVPGHRHTGTVSRTVPGLLALAHSLAHFRTHILTHSLKLSRSLARSIASSSNERKKLEFGTIKVNDGKRQTFEAVRSHPPRLRVGNPTSSHRRRQKWETRKRARPSTLACRLVHFAHTLPITSEKTAVQIERSFSGLSFRDREIYLLLGRGFPMAMIRGACPGVASDLCCLVKNSLTPFFLAVFWMFLFYL